jgi:hypothetical protein
VFKPKLKGFMVGNGVTNWKYDTEPAYLQMGYFHSLYDTRTFDSMHEKGCDYSGLALGLNITEECMDLYSVFANATTDIDIYNIFGYCYGLPDPNATQNEMHLAVPGHKERGLTVVSGHLKSYKKTFSQKDYTPWLPRFRLADKVKNLKETPPCVDGAAVIQYMNQADVRTALHIPAEYPAWDMCNSDTFQYTSLHIGSQWIYESLKGQYRMLHFSGDIDGAVPTTGTLGWIKEMNPIVKEEWRPYKLTDSDEIAGYIEEYEGLTFASVHGAGHMVP